MNRSFPTMMMNRVILMLRLIKICPNYHTLTGYRQFCPTPRSTPKIVRLTGHLGNSSSSAKRRRKSCSVKQAIDKNENLMCLTERAELFNFLSLKGLDIDLKHSGFLDSGSLISTKLNQEAARREPRNLRK